MKKFLPALAVSLVCLAACVDINTELGGSLIPVDQTYLIFPKEAKLPVGTVSMRLTDSLSGFSQTRITVGAIRDEEFGLTTRKSAFTLVPVVDTLDFGNVSAAKVRSFHFAAAADSTSVASLDQTPIIQRVRVHSLAKPLNAANDYDCFGSTVSIDESKSIVQGTPTINGIDSLTFDFTEEYARRFLTITQEDLGSFERYTKKIPGIVISTDDPIGVGGRINIFDLQVGFTSNSGNSYVSGNYASLNLSCDYDWDGIPETDTSFFFMYGLPAFMDVDSLFTQSGLSRGEYPEYALNITSHETRSAVGEAHETISIEGGGGLKPVISAIGLKHLAEEMIRAEGGDPATAVINKATLTFPFPFPDDYREMFKFPQVLSPTCRLTQGDTLVMFASLTDAASTGENQGEINRSTLCYEPDITYHLQEILKIKETPSSEDKDLDVLRRKKLLEGQYDIWLIITAHEVTVTENDTSLNDYYQMLAYQNYYNSMYYGGYGGYGGYGYGGYGGYGYGDYYSNYYTMMMYASLLDSSSTTTTSSDQLDKDRYYCGKLYGPEYPDVSLRPRFSLTFSIPNSEK